MKKVVILDDNIEIRQKIKRILGKFIADGFKLQIFADKNEIEGLNLIFRYSPDLVIIDLTLPKNSGMEVIMYLNSNQEIVANSKIIILAENPDDIRTLNLSENFIVFDKTEKNIFMKLERELAKFLEVKEKASFAGRLKEYSANKLEFLNKIFLKR
ncbi:MAG: hypothetical protein KatS3mg085_366 [Candidatus Dojkabacteria bacterium]|nr:MAG: hypothetical protein KatS3mg085_366 [Candidatus Dojkabacteria bacterium]